MLLCKFLYDCELHERLNGNAAERSGLAKVLLNQLGIQLKEDGLSLVLHKQGALGMK
jgi:hypothetical protein